MTQTIYIDMDGVLCDFVAHRDAMLQQCPGIAYPQSQYGFFRDLPPIRGGLEAMHDLLASAPYDPYILTAPSTRNPLCYTEKRVWVEEHLGMPYVERLIISPNKALLKGAYLIDDHQSGRGQEEFEGELIHFGSSQFPTWSEVMAYLLPES